MSVCPSSDTTAGVVRDSIDVRRLPWIRPLVAAYANDFPSVATLFAGNPADPAAWRQAIARVQRAPRDRHALAAILRRQLDRRRAPAEAREAAEALGHDQSVAIVTGQQAGVFGGPLYTLLKSATALQLARRVREEHGTSAIAVFWVDEEDHDWNEIRTAELLDANLSLSRVELSGVDGAGHRPIASLTLDDGINDALAELQRLLSPTEFTSDVMAQLRAHYRPGAGVAAAFAGWLDSLLGRHGLVVFESADPAAKPLVADVFVRELTHPGKTAALARDAGQAMSRLGHQPQVEPADDSVALFYLDSAGRRAIRRHGDDYVVDDAVRSASELRDEARSAPQHFSPNVLLRPLVQDRLFPTVCYVSGPSELAYQAQLRSIYREFEIEAPLLYPRATATVLDAGAVRFLDRYRLSLEALHAQDDSALNRLLENQLPPAIEQLLTEMENDIGRRAGVLKAEIVALDPTLSGAVDTTVERIQETTKTLHHKIIQASKRKDETLRRQFQRTRALAFPGGESQERVLNLVFFLNRHGPAFPDRLLETLPLDMGRHLVLTP